MPSLCIPVKPVSVSLENSENTVTSIKLDYDVIEEPCNEMEDVWSELIDGTNRNQFKMDLNVFKAGAGKGW